MSWKCKCGGRMLTIQTRRAGSGKSRRHECVDCGMRCTTVEFLADEYNRSVAQNGTIIDQHAHAMDLHAAILDASKRFTTEIQGMVK